MSFIGDILGDVVGGITGADDAAAAAQQAGNIQYQATLESIEEQRRQFDTLVDLLSPFVGVGEESLQAQRAMVGLAGPEAEAEQIRRIESSPLFSGLVRQGEEAILQNASATGGLRGGNVQGALAQFRPQLLNQLLEELYGRLGGLTNIGQASAAGQGAQGIATGANIADLIQQGGAAQAGGTLAAGGAQRQAFGDLLNAASTAATVEEYF